MRRLRRCDEKRKATLPIIFGEAFQFRHANKGGAFTLSATIYEVGKMSAGNTSGFGVNAEDVRKYPWQDLLADHQDKTCRTYYLEVGKGFIYAGFKPVSLAIGLLLCIY